MLSRIRKRSKPSRIRHTEQNILLFVPVEDCRLQIDCHAPVDDGLLFIDRLFPVNDCVLFVDRQSSPCRPSCSVVPVYDSLPLFDRLVPLEDSLRLVCLVSVDDSLLLVDRLAPVEDSLLSTDQGVSQSVS